MDRVKGMANAARQKLQKSDPNEPTNEEPEALRQDHQKLREVRSVLQEVINAAHKANKSSTAAIEDGRALGESFGQHGRGSEPGSGLGVCALRAAEFTKYVEDIKYNLSSKLLVSVVQIFEDLINTDITNAVATRKKLEKARTTCEDASSKVKQANKNKANLTKLLEAEKEFDTAKLEQDRTCAQALNDSQAALKACESKSIEAYANYLGSYKEYFEKGLAYVTGLLQEVADARRAYESAGSTSSAPGASGSSGAVPLKRPANQQFAVNPGLAALKSPQSRESSAGGGAVAAPTASVPPTQVPPHRGSNPPAITEQERFRNAVRDAVTSERSFLESLNLLQQLAGLARRDEKVQAKVPPDELSSIFYKVDHLVQVHQEIIAALETQSNSADELSALFLNKLKALQVHAEYSMHIAQSLDLLDANRKAHRSVEAFAKNAETKAGMDLHVLLLMPVHRTTVYFKLMARVVQQNEGHQRAAEALARLTELVELVNTNHRISASVSTLMSLQRKLQRVEPPAPTAGGAPAPGQQPATTSIAEELNVDIVSPDRRLLFEGSLFSVNKKDPDFYIFLFNDMVLVTKKQTLLKQMFSPDVMKQMINEKESVLYKVLAQLQLSQIEVEELPATEAATGLRLHATGSPLSFSMFAPTVAARDEWIARIRSAAEERTKSRVFGVPLETLVARNSESGSGLPVVLEQTIAFLREVKAAQVEGVFRLSGQSQEIDAVRNQYNKEGKARFSADTDVHCVTGVLKLWLRQLPDYLLTNALYDQWMNVCKLSESDQAAAVLAAKTTLLQLPPANRAVVHHLFAYLDEVRANSTVNKMTSANLATIFGPALVWKKSLSPYDMEAYKRAYSVVQLLLDKYAQIFGAETPAAVKKPLPVSPRGRTDAPLPALPSPSSPPPSGPPVPKHAPPPVPSRPSSRAPPDTPLPDPQNKSPRPDLRRRDSNVDAQVSSASPAAASPLTAALSAPASNAAPAPPVRPLPTTPPAAATPPPPPASSSFEPPPGPAPAPPPRPSPRIDDDFKRQAEEEFKRMEQLQYQQHVYAMPLAPLQPVTAQPVASRTSAPGGTQPPSVHICKGCMGHIVGPFLQACGGEWHVEHFVCGRCGGSLQQGFFDTGTHPLCASCSASVPQ